MVTQNKKEDTSKIIFRPNPKSNGLLEKLFSSWIENPVEANRTTNKNI